MEPGLHSVEEFSVQGWQYESPASVVRTFEEHGPRGVARIGGDFVVRIKCAGAVHLISSQATTRQHFYAVKGGQCYDGPSVMDVVRRANLAWSWDFQAVADAIALAHVMGEETFHREVRGVPPAAVVTLADGRAHVERMDVAETVAPTSPEALIERFRQAALDCLSDELPNVLAMSGGMDSRAVLSALLWAGVKPTLVVIGDERSFDVQVATMIAERFELTCHRVRLDSGDYPECGAWVSSLCGGTKSIENWHAAILARKTAHCMGSRVNIVAGSNGEYARTHYFDRGWVSLAADHAMPAGPAKRMIWRRKARCRLSRETLAHLRGDLRDAVCDVTGRVRRIVDRMPGGLLDGMDHFYLHERVHQFIGNGVRLMASVGSARSPFMDPEWISLCRGMDRRHKLMSRWHRMCIAANAPELLEFPESGTGHWMRASVRLPLYKPRVRVKALPYNPESVWADNGDCRRVVREQAETFLADLADPEWITRCVEDGGPPCGDIVALRWLMTLAFLGIALHDVESEKGAKGTQLSVQ